MEERIKKNSTISGLIDNMGTVVYLPNGKKYNFFPYWFESTTQEMEDYITHHLDKLPSELKERIREYREDCNDLKIFDSMNFPIKIFLDYEIRSSWFAEYISWKWLQEISARYFAWKTSRKYERYVFANEREQRILNNLK